MSVIEHFRKTFGPYYTFLSYSGDKLKSVEAEARRANLEAEFGCLTCQARQNLGQTDFALHLKGVIQGSPAYKSEVRITCPILELLMRDDPQQNETNCY